MFKNPVIYMSRRTATVLWRAAFDEDPNLTGTLYFGLGKVEMLYDDRMPLGEMHLEESPDGR